MKAYTDWITRVVLTILVIDCGLFFVGVGTFVFSSVQAQAYLLPAPAGTTWVTSNPTVPSPALGAGYTYNSFSTNTFSATNVDVSATCNTAFSTCSHAFQWYKCNAVTNANYSSTDVSFPGDGSIQLAGYQNCEIASAVKNGNTSTDYIGTAFGGGMYLEIIAKFPNATIPDAAGNGWPALWTLTLEGSYVYAASTCPIPGYNNTNANQCPHWPHQASYFAHQIENDIMEYINGNKGVALHESFGIYNSTCPYSSPTWTKNYCQTDSALSTYAASNDNSIYHKYGLLWIPATATVPGSTSVWVDNVQQAGTTQTYSQFPVTNDTAQTGNGYSPYLPSNLQNFCGGTAYSTSCTNPAWRFGVIDLMHHVVQIGTGTQCSGSNCANPLYIQSVNVWQKNANGNVSK